MNIHSWNLPSTVNSILLRIKILKKKRRKRNSYKIKEGIVYLEPIFDLNEIKLGNKIVYKGNIGIVSSKYNTIHTISKPKIMIYFPKQNKSEHLNLPECHIFVLYDEDLGRIIRLSFHDYEYIEKDMQKIEYYIGKHKYAILSNDFKDEKKWVKLYHTVSNSKTFVKKLNLNNFKIIKK